MNIIEDNYTKPPQFGVVFKSSLKLNLIPKTSKIIGVWEKKKKVILMKKSIKLIAFDIDGTLITKDGRVLKENKKIIKDLKERGIKIVLCTGRNFSGFYWIRQELDLMGYEDYSITCTGAFIRQNATGKALLKKVLSMEDMREIEAKLDDTDIQFAIHTRDILYNKYENPNQAFLNDQKLVRMPWLKYESIDDINVDLPRACFIGEKEKIDDFEKRHKDDFINDYKYMRNEKTIIEILHKDAGKSETLRDLAEMLDLDMSEIMYFGDGANDLKSIEAVGVGVAMGNAREITKEAADYVVGDNDTPAIAEFLKEYFND